MSAEKLHSFPKITPEDADICQVARVDLSQVLASMTKALVAKVSNRLEVHIDADLVLENQVLYLLHDDEILKAKQESNSPENPVDLWKSNFKFALNEIITNALEGRTGSNITSGSSKVTVRAYKKNGQVIVEVQDNGEGILPDIIESMRDLQTKSNKDKKRDGGYGLVTSWEQLIRIGGAMEIGTALAEVVGPEASGTKISFIFDVDGQQTK